jgi:O-antigen ligase
MSPPQPLLQRAAFYCAFGSAASVLFSIAVSQILLALAIAALLISGEKLRLPPVWLPLVLFMAGTALSLALSGLPSAGRPQIRKFFVYLTLLAVFSTFRQLAEVRRLVAWWAGIGALAGVWGLSQFLQRLETVRPAGQGFYESYLGDRMTGPMSHWMTFGGLLMMVLVMLGASLLFSARAGQGGRWVGVLCAGVLALALLLGLTRGIWLGSAGAALYLLWYWKRPLLLALPLLLLAALWLGPASVRTRFLSGFQPRQEVDSNQHRIICWRTGWEMIKAHPWLGLGPELVKTKFMDYVPADIRRPLPAGWYGHLHSIYIHYAAERGIPVLLALLWLLGKCLWDFRRAIRRLPAGPSDERFILHGATAVVLAIMISGISELNLGDSEVLAMFLAVVACGYLAVEKVFEKEPELA